jgi:hypothetical protein
MSQQADEGSIRQFIVRQVLDSIHCSACGAHYGETDLCVVEQHENVWVLGAACPNCDSQAVVMVVVQRQARDYDGFAALAKDDVLNFHSALDGFAGDVRRLLLGDE